MASMGACVGYFAGGLGGSTLTHLDWNERTARAGAFLGGAAQVLAIAGAWGWAAFGATLKGAMATEVFGDITVGHLSSVGGFFYSYSQGDMNGAAYGFVKDFFFPWLPPSLVALPFTWAFREYNRRL